MSNVLVISGHPNLSASNTNQVILESIGKAIEHVEIRRLDTLYPNYAIDVAAEQAALMAADTVVLQFPFYWYSVPALLKKWIDDVLSYGFAYGSKGDKLQNKDLILSFTIGGPDDSYAPLGYNHFPIAQLIQPLQQTAYLTGMTFHEPIYSHGMVFIPGVYNTLEDVQRKAKEHAQRLVAKIDALNRIDETYVEGFVRKWFKAFDALPEDAEHFTKHLADDVFWSMPEGDFVGHHGFEEWYALVRSQFKPGCDHQIQALSVESSDPGFTVNVTLNLQAETFEDSTFAGQPVNVVVKEQWQLHVSDNNQLLIDRYSGDANA